jgi:DNA helicase-4
MTYLFSNDLKNKNKEESEMEKIFSFFIRLYKEYKLRKIIMQIRNRLHVIKDQQKGIQSNIQDLNRYRDYLTDNHISGIELPYMSSIQYLKLDNPFHLNEKTFIFYKKEISWLMEFEFYHEVKDEYMDLKNQFLCQLNQLQELKDKVNAQIEENIKLVERFFSQLRDLKQEYITFSMTEKLSTLYSDSYKFFKSGNKTNNTMVNEFLDTYSDMKSKVSKWNEEYVKRELEANKELFDNIDGKSLDSQQRIAVVTDEDHNLILAGAGSGKTLTISGKVKYLIDRKNVRPEDILLISFTRKAAAEMYDRISNKLNVEVPVKTFHKLGLEIIAQKRNVKPEIADNELDIAIHSYINNELLQDKKQIKWLIEFFGYYLNIPKDYSEFENLGEYHEHCKSLDLQTIKGRAEEVVFIQQATDEKRIELESLSGERVKSLEEIMIANFLFLNGVEYVYEQSYEYKTVDRNYRQYKPDFYLPEYDIYIEHFGITEDQRVPWLNRVEELKYLDGIAWKRKLHAENKTTLIETYSYYNKKGILLSQLKKKLEEHKVELYEIDFKEIFSIIFDERMKNQYFKEFLKLIKTFISLFKSNGYKAETFEKFIKMNLEDEKNQFLKERTDLFLKLISPIFLHYQQMLDNNEAIDFNDMINEATEIVRSDQFNTPYRYIIIDEYQDISKSRFNLIQAIEEKTGAKIICVGDDWQSIYRFAGSDIQLFTQFQKFFGQHELLKIEKTYRNSQELIQIAGDFVMQNPSQFKKKLTSHRTIQEPIKIFGYQAQIHDQLKLTIDEIVSVYGEDTEIMLLGRNNFDIETVLEDSNFKRKKDRDSSSYVIEYSKYPSVHLFFLTAHRSKGLEADNVILLNAYNKINGFPNQIVDDPILSWVLTDSEDFFYAEERRLFYVAMTRTKNRFYILTPEMKTSCFVSELINDYGIPFVSSTKEKEDNLHSKCPRCQSGNLTKRKTKNGERGFVGCTNYPMCDYSLYDIDALENKRECKSCGGYLIKKKGKYGEFFGCSNYPFCKNTKDLKKKQPARV